MSDPLATWAAAARPDDRGVLEHVRQGTGLAPEAPAARLGELTRELNIVRGYLAEAVAEVARLRRDYDRWHRFTDTSFAGVAMAQYQCDLYLWEAVLNSNPGLRGIVEIGTWKGGFSGWLWAQAFIRDMQFVTFDAVVPEREIPGFVHADVFAKPYAVDAAIAKIEEPLVLFCDGGNKPRELTMFAPLLADPGSLVIVHDWGTETRPGDVPAGLEEVYAEECDVLGSITRIFQLKET